MTREVGIQIIREEWAAMRKRCERRGLAGFTYMDLEWVCSVDEFWWRSPDREQQYSIQVPQALRDQND